EHGQEVLADQALGALDEKGYGARGLVRAEEGGDGIERLHGVIARPDRAGCTDAGRPAAAVRAAIGRGICRFRRHAGGDLAVEQYLRTGEQLQWCAEIRRRFTAAVIAHDRLDSAEILERSGDLTRYGLQALGLEGGEQRIELTRIARRLVGAGGQMSLGDLDVPDAVGAELAVDEQRSAAQ